MDNGDYILIVGGAGYIGSHTNKALTSRGYRTLVFDNLISGHRELVKWGSFILGDLDNKEQLGLLFRHYPIKAVLHFAAYAFVGESIENPQKYYLNNVRNSLHLLEVMLEYGVRHLIFSSSCATYGHPVEIPITERHPENPVSPYGRSKLMVDNIIRDYSAAYPLKCVSLRYFNASGADPDAESGEWHEYETRLIPLVLDAAAGRSGDIKVFGSDYETRDGTCVRDYIHVADLASAHVAALEYLLNGGRSDIFNLGNGQGFTVREVIERARIITGKNINIMDMQRRPGDPAILIGSADKAKRVLHWNTRYSDLDTILKTAWRWHTTIP